MYLVLLCEDIIETDEQCHFYITNKNRIFPRLSLCVSYRCVCDLFDIFNNIFGLCGLIYVVKYGQFIMNKTYNKERKSPRFV